MTLLANLQGLDLSSILDARALITAAVTSPDMESVLENGATQTALAGLGNSMQTMRDSIADPSALLTPLMDAVGGLSGVLDLGDLPIVQYTDAVYEGASIVATLFQGLDGDPAEFGSNFGLSLGDALDTARAAVDGYAEMGLDGLVQMRHLLDTVEQGVPTDPQAFAELAIDVLLPFSRTNLIEIRDGVSGLLDGASGIALPSGRTSGLVLALDAVATAAATGDAGALGQALQDLEQVRENTLSVIRDDCLSVFEQLGSLRIDQSIEPLVSALDALRSTNDGMLEFLEKWRAQIEMMRQQIQDFDTSQIITIFTTFLDTIEGQARDRFVEPFDVMLDNLADQVRQLLRHLHLRQLRREVTEFFRFVVSAIQDVDLDGPAQEARAFLEQIQSSIEAIDVGDEIQAALTEAEEAITGMLDEVTGALGTISAQIDALAEEAQEVLEPVASAIADFRSVIDEITAAIDDLGIEQATEQVIDILRDLREAAEDLLANAPLPDLLRPLVEQVISALENVDFEVVFRPVWDAVAELEISDEVGAVITDALEAASDALANLIPAEVIDSIEAEIGSALDVIGNFDPATLLGDVTGYLDEMANFIEALDPRLLVDEVSGPYQAVLDGIDATHPRVLLAPVIDAYNSLLGSLPIPAPETAMRRTSDLLESTGTGMARAMTEPVRHIAPEGAVSVPESGAGTDSGTGNGNGSGSGSGSGSGNGNGGGSESQTLPPLPGSFRPGDVVRVFAFLPEKLKEALAELDEGVAGEALHAVDSLCGGLARNLRALQAAMKNIEVQLNAGLDELLWPLSEAQLRAQIAIQANFSVGSLEVDAMGAVALAGPAPMRGALADNIQLIRDKARATARATSGRAGASLERAAVALERCSLAAIGDDVDAFLAALDPEPIAAEMDALVAALYAKAPEVFEQIGDELMVIIDRFKALVEEINPGTQIQKFTRVLDVLFEEMDLLNPARLADELGEIHAEIRRIVEAYDPAVFAEELYGSITAVADQVRALDPATFLGDLTLFEDIATRVGDAIPTNALAGVGESLAGIGEELTLLDPAGLLESIDSLGPRVVGCFEEGVEAIRREIIALLEAIRYTSGSGSGSATVEVGVG